MAPERLRKILSASPEFYSEDNAISVANRRKWWLRGAPLLVEVLRGELYGDPDRVVEIDVEGSTAYLWSPEDTAWQYMQSSLATRDRTGWERARAIAEAQAALDWDWDYLASRADALAPAGLVDALRDRDSYEDMLARLE